MTAEEDNFTAYALCSKNIGVKEVAETVGFKSTNQGSGTAASAKCPSEKRVISGGFEFSTLVSNSPVFRSRPTDQRSWSVLALSEDSDSKLKVLAYACPTEAASRPVRTRRRSALTR